MPRFCFDNMSTMRLRSLFHHVSDLAHDFRRVQSVSLHSSSILNLQEEFQERRKTHKYEDRWKYTSVKSTSEYLLQHIIYNENGVIGINKPPGLGSSKQAPSIYHSIPFLAEQLGYKELTLVSVPDKEASGITIFAANPKFARRIHTAVLRSKSIYCKNPKKTFLAVTVGQPQDVDHLQQYGVTTRLKDKIKYNFILRDWGENEVKRREVNIGWVEHKILSKSEHATLVSVSTWQERLHLPRLLMSDILISPALGDQKYGARVGTLFEEPVLMKPWNAPAVKALVPHLLQKLHIRSGSEALIPLHFHSYEVLLHGYLPHRNHLFLTADPPDFFKWTCEKLNLELPKLKECCSVESQNSNNPDTIDMHCSNVPSGY